MQARNQGTPVGTPAVPPFQNEGTEAQTTRQAADTGRGDRVMQARATLNAARALDSQGKGEACLDTIRQAERQLGAP